VPEMVLPVFGAENAGKTQLMLLFVMAARDEVEDRGGRMEAADAHSREWIEDQMRRLDQIGRPDKTGTRLGAPYVLRIQSPRRRSRTLKIFDMGGEVYSTSERLDELRFVVNARTWVFVLDPLAVEAFWTTLTAAARHRLAGVRSEREPHWVFETAVQAFAAMDVPLRRVRLVVALSKSDLIRDELRQAGVNSDASIRQWLCEGLRESNMVHAMEHHFGTVQFILTAALHHGDDVDDSVKRLVDVVFRGEGLRQ
jgi:hypothetical protein